MLRLLVRLMFAIAITASGAVPARAQLTEAAMPYIPAQANAVAKLDLQGLLASPLGVERNWTAKHEQAYLDGSLTIPPWVGQLLRASHFTPGQRGEDWSVAFVPLDNPVRIEHIAGVEGTEIQQLQGKRTVLSHRYGGYFAELIPAGASAGLLGLFAPASRQDAATWLAAGGTGTKISGYLQENLKRSEDQVVLAVDMNEMLDPSQVRYRLDGAAAIQGNALAKSALTLDFQSLLGVRLTVRADKALSTQLRLDFKRPLGEEAQFVKPLVIEFLADAGAELDDFAAAEVKVDKQSVTLSAPLSDMGFRKILSLITTVHPSTGGAGPSTTPTAPAPAAPSGAYDLVASQRYYNAVIKNLEDLEKTFRARNPSYDRSAAWHESYANRIERMPTQGVHPQLVDFGTSMAHGLRILAESLRGSSIELKSLDSKIVYQKEYRYEPQTGFDWWWGPPRTVGGYVATPENTRVIVHTNVDEVRQAQREATAMGAAQREQIWSGMAGQRDDVQKDMIRVFGRTFVMP